MARPLRVTTVVAPKVTSVDVAACRPCRGVNTVTCGGPAGHGGDGGGGADEPEHHDRAGRRDHGAGLRDRDVRDSVPVSGPVRGGARGPDEDGGQREDGGREAGGQQGGTTQGELLVRDGVLLLIGIPAGRSTHTDGVVTRGQPG